MRSDLFGRSAASTLITDFFGGVAQVDTSEPSTSLASPPVPPRADTPKPKSKKKKSKKTSTTAPAAATTPNVGVADDSKNKQKQREEREESPYALPETLDVPVPSKWDKMRNWTAAGVVSGLIGLVFIAS